jgi:CRISPR-associated protein (TIGR03985 family)
MVNSIKLNRTFDFRPEVELLQILARGSLKQNLPKAVRLWVILRSLYGDEADPVRVQLAETFTYSQWRNQFFTQPEFHREDKFPENHDPHCACAKTLKDWLFSPEMGVNSDDWRRCFRQLYPLKPEALESLLTFGGVEPYKNLHQNRAHRLFAMTRKNLQYDFKALVEMGWLEIPKPQTPLGKNSRSPYQKVRQFPCLQPSSAPENLDNGEGSVRNVIQNDLVDFFEDFSREINGQQRFFLEIEYVIHRQFSAQIHTLRQQLKQIWEQIPVPPACVRYVSARNFQNHQDEGEEYIIYPVCLYYSHRAPYLFAFGETPRSPTQMDWYDYRLDRIKHLQPLDWHQVEKPQFNREICASKTPQMIEELRSEAWGFDFYKPYKLLLLRFDPYFHNRYIEGTERDELFKKIPLKQAQKLISNAQVNSLQHQQLLSLLKSHPCDVYCRLNYRQDDYNVIMRLRAWGAMVEVLLPWDLRELMATEIQKTWKLYHRE